MLQGKSRENKQKMDKRDSLNNCQCILRVTCSTYYKFVSAFLTTRKKCISWILIESVKQVKLVASWISTINRRLALFYIAMHEMSFQYCIRRTTEYFAFTIFCIHFCAFKPSAFFFMQNVYFKSIIFLCNKWRKLH